MSKQIIWSLSSENDFAEILAFLKRRWNNKVAFQFISKTDHLLNQITKNPIQFPIIHKQLKIRKCVISKYNALYYHVTTHHIQILRIYDTRQNPQNLKFE